MSLSKKVNLKYPVLYTTDKGTKIELNELEFTRIKVRNLKALPKGFFDNVNESGQLRVNPIDFLPLIASLANIPVETADEIDFEDLTYIVSEVIVPFLGESQKSGKN